MLLNSAPINYRQVRTQTNINKNKIKEGLSNRDVTKNQNAKDWLKLIRTPILEAHMYKFRCVALSDINRNRANLEMHVKAF